MSRTAAVRTAIGADRPTAAGILALIHGIERYDAGAPAALAFRSALSRKGAEAHSVGGPAALDDLVRAVAEAHPGRADARAEILRTAWANVLPDPGERVRP